MNWVIYSVILVYVYIGVVSSVTGDTVDDGDDYSLPSNSTINAARCQARCYDKYGVQASSDSLLRYCDSKECNSCLIPCNYTVTDFTTCGTSICGVDIVCLDSCTFQQSIVTGQPYLQTAASPVELEPPNIVCKNVSYGENGCKENDVAGLFIKWRHVLPRGDSDNSLVYILSARYQEEEDDDGDEKYDTSQWKVKMMIQSVYVGIKDLRCSTYYQFMVTAVNANGIVGHSKPSEWSKTLGYNYEPSTPLELHVQKLSIVNQKPRATVVWTPGKDPSCSYQIVWLGDKSEQDEIKVNASGSFEYRKNLEYSTDYKIRLSSMDYLFEARSDELVINLTTPECLKSTNYNHSACAPLQPMNLTVDVMQPSYESNVNVSLSWNPPPFTRDGDITEYTLTCRKEPFMGTPKRIEPHKVEMIVDGSETTVEINNLHNHNIYSFILSATSRGGKGPSETKRLYIGKTPTNYSFYDEKDVSEVHHQGVDDESLTALELLSVILIPVVLFLVLVGVICLIAYRRRKYRNYSSQRRFGPIEEMNPIYEGITMNINTDKVPQFEADGYEIDYTRLDFISVIGEGAFGKVVKAEYYPRADDRRNNKGKIVAVKMLRDFYTGDESRNFLLEIQAMKNLGHHPCIVSIIGCCLTGPKLCLIMDYCALGDLRNYLRKYREKLMYTIPAPYGMMIKTPNCYMQDQMFQQEKQTSNTSSNSNDGTIPSEVSEAQLLSYARQVTMGMEFLEQRKFIHRDLATRNILLFDNSHAKISDFGLTRDVYETNVYQPTSGRKLPYKWMAIESLFTQRFTIKSDVWSFGIVLWEIVTLGGSPYPSIPLKDLYGLLNEGYRMEKPESCSSKLYQIMLSCWHPNPHSRPSFSQLRDELEKLLEETRSYIDLSVEVSEDYFNESTNESNQQGETTVNVSGDTLSQNEIDEYESSQKLLADVHSDVISGNSNVDKDSMTAYSDRTLDCDDADYLESVLCRNCDDCLLSNVKLDDCDHSASVSCEKCDSVKSVHSTKGKSHHLVKSSFHDNAPALCNRIDDTVDSGTLKRPTSSSLAELCSTNKLETTSL